MGEALVCSWFVHERYLIPIPFIFLSRFIPHTSLPYQLFFQALSSLNLWFPPRG